MKRPHAMREAVLVLGKRSRAGGTKTLTAVMEWSRNEVAAANGGDVWHPPEHDSEGNRGMCLRAVRGW